MLLFVENAEDPEAIRIAGYYDWTEGNDIAFEPSQVLIICGVEKLWLLARQFGWIVCRA